MKDNINNLNFLKNTIHKFKSEIHKMIADSNYPSSDVNQLKNTFDEIEDDISHREKWIISNYFTHSKPRIINNNSSSLLPQISHSERSVFQEDQVYTSLKYKKQSTINKSISFRKRDCSFDAERELFKQNMIKRHFRGDMEVQRENRMKSFLEAKERNRLLAKYHINNTLFDKLKIPSFLPNYMNREKRQKYSNMNKRNNYHSKKLDAMKNPIIRKEDVATGLMNMIYRGLIPKNADVTPAFEAEGHPMQVNVDLSQSVHKSINDETKDKDIPFDIQLNSQAQDKNDFFITKPQENIQLDMPNSTERKEVMGNLNSHQFLHESNSNRLIERKTLVFSNYHIAKNDQYLIFNKEHLDKWGAITYLFASIEKVLIKLHLNFVELYQDKIMELINDEMKAIKDKGILSCMVEHYLHKKQIDPIHVSHSLNHSKNDWVMMIQTAFRSFHARLKLKKIKLYFYYVQKIQNAYKSASLIAQAQTKAQDLYERRYEEWTRMMNRFKTRWDIIKSLPHIEIHLNSISAFTSNNLFLNSTRLGFQEKENNQINRLAKLNDPNVEIIYISPYPISSDIVSYYSSILNTVGVDKVKERLHILVPSAAEQYSPHFPLSQLLILSPETIRIIKALVGKKEAFIFPGSGGKNEVELSMLLDIPVLMGDLYQTEATFTKSGVKLLLEGNEIKAPFSIWGIESEEDFYESLGHLIVSYSHINVWVFKMDYETNGRGIAYIQLNLIPQYNDLLKRKLAQTLDDQLKEAKEFKASLDHILKTNLPKKVKIATSLLYKSWDEYLSNYIKYRGLIEACPTAHLSNIISSPCVSFLIEPSGKIDSLLTYDKVNCHFFRNVAAISPQRALNGSELEEIALKLGAYLYQHNIIGYISIEFIVFRNKDNQLHYWAIDVKFGLNDLIASINFSSFLYSSSKDKALLGDLYLANETKPVSQCNIGVIPFFSHQKIASLNINSLVKAFRDEKLIYDIGMTSGVIFNLSNRLECGSMGLCCISNPSSESNNPSANLVSIWKMMNMSSRVIASLLRINEYQNNILLDQRNDIIELSDIISQIAKQANRAELLVEKSAIVRKMSLKSFKNQ